MLLEYLKENYETNEPIFASDINLPVTDTNLRQMFKTLCDKGQIERYDNGIYYLKAQSILKGAVTISATKVARYKYISRNGKVAGYYSGFTFANQIGLSTQVPFKQEIVSNSASAKCREISIGKLKFIIRCPRTEVNSSNCDILQLLDLLKDLDEYSEYEKDQTREVLTDYIKRMKIKKSDIDRYVGLYPDKVYRSIYEMRLYDVFA